MDARLRKVISPEHFLTYLCLLFLSLFTTTCGGEKDHLAVIEERPVTVEKFKAALEKRSGRILTEKDKELLLEELVDFEVLYAAAVKEGYDRNPQIQENLRRMIADKFREEVLDPKIDALSVTDEEIAEYYRGHTDEFIMPEMVRAAIIKIAVPENTSDEKRAELRQKTEKAREEALALDSETASFGSVAITHSDDLPTRYRGGDSGWLEPGKNNYRWSREVTDAIFLLKTPGEVSEVITAPEGFFLVRLMERKQRRPQELAQVKGKIRYRLIRDKRRQAKREFYDGLRKKVSVSVNKEKLSSIALPEPVKKKMPEPPPMRK